MGVTRGAYKADAPSVGTSVTGDCPASSAHAWWHILSLRDRSDFLVKTACLMRKLSNDTHKH